MPNFPSDPANGTQVVEKQPNGDLIIWTYDRPTNTWSYEYWEGIEGLELLFYHFLVKI